MKQYSNFTIKDTDINLAKVKANETLFSLANGHVGVRGNFEESILNTNYKGLVGTYINGFYESAPIQYGEWAYGYAKNHQTICKVPNSHYIIFKVDQETFNLDLNRIKKHRRELDMEKGLLRRKIIWETKTEKKVEILIERMVSMIRKEVVLQTVEIVPINFDGNIEIKHYLSGGNNEFEDILDPRVGSHNHDRLLIETDVKNELSHMLVSTINSDLHVCCSTESLVCSGELKDKQTILKDREIESILTLDAKKGNEIECSFITCYSDVFNSKQEAQSSIKRLYEITKDVEKLGIQEFKNRHIIWMKDFWMNSDIELQGDEDLQQGVRFSLFHLNQAAGRDGKTNISAKGLSGDGYEGHYFWDTEIYMLPYFIYTQPDVAKKLLMYRYSILPQARKRACELGVSSGALFPWRTINGEECSAYYPAGTAQFHINADIANSVKTYYEATLDKKFMLKYGLEILIETARFWRAFGDYIPEKENKFCINGVTGPDEYTAIVNNNFYTNIMAKQNLLYAAEMVEHFMQELNLEIKQEEIKEWKCAGENMYLPYDNVRQLTKQDDSFFEKTIWDFKQTPKENYPLLLNYHPLTIYRYQVNKQADTILGEFLFSEKFTKEQKERDYEYYKAITTHDSSLSYSIFGLMACDIGRTQEAYKYFMKTALMDIGDYQGNTADGIHAANMGGLWMSLVYGFGGMRVNKDKLLFRPRLPLEWQGLKFRIQYRGRQIEVNIKQTQTSYRLLIGKSIELLHENQVIFLKLGQESIHSNKGGDKNEGSNL